jgi:hypothetical protein
VFIRHEVGVLRLRKFLILLFILLPASLTWLSCGGYSNPSSGGGQTVYKYRAFVTNSVSAGTEAAGVYVVDAQNDVRANVSAIQAGNNPGMMVLTPNRADTLVFSGTGTQGSDNQLTVINNASSTAAGHVTLPGLTQSIVVSPNSSTAYAAVPTAPVIGQSPGAVEVVDITSGTITAAISCPSGNPNPAVCVPAPTPPVVPPNYCDVTPDECPGFNAAYTYLFIGNTGTRVLAFSQGSDPVANEVALITPTSVATSNPVITFVDGVAFGHPFDHPVWAFFNSDDSTAYVLNCGAECGGVQASVQSIDLTTSPPTPGVAVPISAGSVALVNNSTLYIAGTPMPPSPCTGQTTLAASCGFLTQFNVGTMSVVNPTGCSVGTNCPYIITDGYHTHIALGANGQLFIGARNCTEIVPTVPPPAGAEVRGCLSIFNTLDSAVGGNPAGGVLIPPENGDVTSIQPVATRQVVYLIQGAGVQGGTLYIYDALTDALFDNPHNPNNPGQVFGLVGQFVDVKTVDF